MNRNQSLAPTIRRLGLLALVFALQTVASAEVTLTHVHGLSFSADGKQLYVPSHVGLAVYSGGHWSNAAGPQHDYMGFAATKNGFYSSGHPAAGSDLVNPFGLMKSADGGKTWTRLGLQREADFQLLAASHDTSAVYVYNAAPNSRMSQPGLYSTLNDGLEWKHAEARGPERPPVALAVHPTKPATVAVGTKSGLFLSEDGGNSFRPLGERRQVVGVFFDLDGKELWYSSFAGQASLTRLGWSTSKNAEVKLPPLTQDAVAYIAQNPIDRSEYAIATFERSVYLSNDAGKTWRRIADRGRGS